ncbi:class I SAM-dependent methyltransferase [Rhizobacter sp. AJA081-3]|uniref:class I SAM-dependent methyltransferase n=1 Tax=Rhizobacter sp. AJA081-3 TaxID=2753607 RepID=UPI001AE0A4F6|nr:class I SAM-dependent methyltransferase [Rhizobacter sp. AJA081-3]QTN21716.1 class I SAM-dependent methyltransferase [Rhizobacter sp. AJA081-3]
MDRDQIKSIFDRQAPTYDQQWAKLSALREGLHLLLGSVFATLPAQARILCVGAGTGAEIQHLALLFPGWSFTAVEPSPAMLSACRERAESNGYAQRCRFHEGYLDSLPTGEPFDAATCLLVSQFILDRPERAAFFRTIAERLRPGGLLASADLASDLSSASQRSLLEVWFRTMATADLSAEALQRMRDAYERDVAVLPPAEVEAIIRAGGFDTPVRFFQAGLMHAWFSRVARDTLNTSSP